MQQDIPIQNQVIKDISKIIRERGLEAPAIFVLEMYKPLAGVFYNFSLAMYPMLVAICGIEKCQEMASLLKSPQAIECLIQALESAELNDRENA